LLPIIDIIAEHYKLLLFRIDYKWFDWCSIGEYTKVYISL